MVSKNVIEVEGLGSYETALRLSVDKHLIAENLTQEETRRLIVGILDRIAVVVDVGENAEEPCTTEFARARRH
jgi:hypothetical protein